MKLLVTGSRGWQHKGIIHRLLCQLKPDSVVHGDCKDGADAMADLIATRLRIPVKRYPACWELLGKSAGIQRNTEMLVMENPDVVLAFWDGQSRGTKHTIDTARELNLKVMVVRIDAKGQPKITQYLQK